MYSLDRFSRNRYDSAIYKAKLKRNGVKIYYVTQPIPEGPEGIIFESIMEGYAEYYSVNLARNIKRGLKENALPRSYLAARVSAIKPVKTSNMRSSRSAPKLYMRFSTYMRPACQ